jgi:lipopolysaccharide/colanic/teichoic acid biosynthesis glycosyltransferase
MKPPDRVKRTMDVALAGVALVLLAPVTLAVAMLVLLAMGRPVLFRQTRPGAAGRLFKLVKFRTMRVADASRGAVSNLASDGARLTRLGAFLRATSLDELPTLWNVVRGDMSLVGPRPLLVEYLDRYTPEQARRHELRPGITGLAQVRGRNALSWDEKFAFDVWYVEHRSLKLDLHILAQTILAVVRRDGIAAENNATMPEFVATVRDSVPTAREPTTVFSEERV